MSIRPEISPQRVYVLGWQLFVSVDAGRTFREDLSAKVHSDIHALAIQAGSHPPARPTKAGEADAKPKPPVSQRLLMGTDGGIYQSFDGGSTWDFLNKRPLGQFYRIDVDQSTPYRIAGGLQDNCNWVGPSQNYTKEGIRSADWTYIGGGDGFYCVFDPKDPGLIYAESQGGEVFRFNARTGERRGWKPKPTEGQPAFRFHWNSPLIGSPQPLPRSRQPGPGDGRGGPPGRLRPQGRASRAGDPRPERRGPARRRLPPPLRPRRAAPLGRRRRRGLSAPACRGLGCRA